ncbi:hypothetical protein BRADI_1g69048v3 [Brachypodium distachyon]|uniref:Uncharacterized protein n=1 Tax=Brachypodium distachyon TaxID=15368 RepID=A0A0Q3JZ47_BRADI|nr:hypothetical protein BRADI_1g69048v3 [Brachypodium distachyon]
MAGRHLNKDVSCVLGGDRTGVICLAPGSPPLVARCPFVCSSHRSDYLEHDRQIRIYKVLQSRNCHGSTTQRARYNQQFTFSIYRAIYEVKLRSSLFSTLFRSKSIVI